MKEFESIESWYVRVLKGKGVLEITGTWESSTLYVRVIGELIV